MTFTITATDYLQGKYRDQVDRFIDRYHFDINDITEIRVFGEGERIEVDQVWRIDGRIQFANGGIDIRTAVITPRYPSVTDDHA